MNLHRSNPGPAAALVGWLDQGLSLYGEVTAWRDLRNRLLSEQEPPAEEIRAPSTGSDQQPSPRIDRQAESQSGRQYEDQFERGRECHPGSQPNVCPEKTLLWYEADQPLLLATEREIRATMAPTRECPHFFYVREDSKRLGAIGLVQISTGIRIKVDIAFPEEFPQQPPHIFFFGPAVGFVASRLRPDGSIPVPAGGSQQWTSAMSCAAVIRWAIEWLKSVFALRGSR